MQSDKISVLMGIYNCEDTLRDAVRSIQNQSYSNWELIMCDDGSTDNTYRLAKELSESDCRLVVLKNEKNSGLNITLNRCLKHASGEYIARMDGDDICEKERFEKQLRFLKSQKKYAICSSSMFFFDEEGIWGRNHPPLYPTVEQVVTKSPICHAPVMMKRECMERVNGYTEDKRMMRVEDVNLWIKLYAVGYRCFNIQEALYGMRNDRNAFNRRKYKYRINATYVRLKGCQEFKLPIKCYVKAFYPMIIGLVPASIRFYIRKKQNRTI